MRVEDVMTHVVKSCSPTDTLDVPAQIMWDHDCGCVPVCDESGAAVAMITDRDVCMATHLRGLAPSQIAVADAMSRALWVCHPADAVDAAERVMREHQVRRLPVVADDGRLLGILSLNDLTRAAEQTPRGARDGISPRAIEGTLAAIGAHRDQAISGSSTGNASPPSVGRTRAVKRHASRDGTTSPT